MGVIGGRRPGRVEAGRVEEQRREGRASFIE
jgi:hypothetical protein